MADLPEYHPGMVQTALEVPVTSTV